MFKFWKKRRKDKLQRQADLVQRAQEAKQQRKFEVVRDVQEAILALQARIDEPARPAALGDELAAVKASFERGLRGDRG